MNVSFLFMREREGILCFEFSCIKESGEVISASVPKVQGLGRFYSVKVYWCQDTV